METKAITSRAMSWFVACSVVAVLYLARPFLVPVALAGFIAFILDPLVRRLARSGMRRIAATILTMAGVTLVVTGIGWMLIAQVQGFAEHLPEYRAQMRQKSAEIRSTLGSGVERATTTIRELGNELASSAPGADAAAPISTGTNASAMLEGLLGSVLSLSALAALVFLLATVMLLRWDDLRDRLLALAGESDLARSTHASKEAAAKVSLFLRRQLIVNSMHGTAVGLLLWWIGVPNPLVWGLLSGVLRFVPYVGPVVGTCAPILVSFASSDGWTETWITASALLMLEVVTNNVVEPWFYAGATGVSPLALLVSAAFWTWIWGAPGLVLSTPLTVCLIVVGKHVRSLRFLDVLLGTDPVMSQGSRLYHRLLAGESDEAWEIVRRESSRSSVMETADNVLMPAMGLVSTARDDGRLDVEERESIRAIVHGIVDELTDLQPPQVVPVPAGALRTLCIGARDAFDSAGSRVLARELRHRGIDATSGAPEILIAEVIESMRRDEVDLIVISSVIPTHFLHIRSLCKRLLSVESRAEILLGLWGESASAEELAQRLPASPRLSIATTMASAVTWTETAAIRLVASRSKSAAS